MVGDEVEDLLVPKPFRGPSVDLLRGRLERDQVPAVLHCLRVGGRGS